MFNTGARVQEIADLQASDLQLTKPFQVRLFGKGRKERYCPLWPQTAAVLRSFSKEQDLDLRSETRVFLNHRGGPLTRFGIRYILARCLAHASQDAPNLRKKRLHPHSVRHYLPLPQRKVSIENDAVHTVVPTFEKIGVMIAKSVRHSWRIIRQQVVVQLPRQGRLFLSEVSEKA